MAAIPPARPHLFSNSRPSLEALLHRANQLAVAEIVVALRQPQASLINLLHARAADLAEVEAAVAELEKMEASPLWGAF